MCSHACVATVASLAGEMIGITLCAISGEEFCLLQTVTNLAVWHENSKSAVCCLLRLTPWWSIITSKKAYLAFALCLPRITFLLWVLCAPLQQQSEIRDHCKDATTTWLPWQFPHSLNPFCFSSLEWHNNCWDIHLKFICNHFQQGRKCYVQFQQVFRSHTTLRIF